MEKIDAIWEVSEILCLCILLMFFLIFSIQNDKNQNYLIFEKSNPITPNFILLFMFYSLNRTVLNGNCRFFGPNCRTLANRDHVLLD